MAKKSQQKKNQTKKGIEKTISVKPSFKARLKNQWKMKSPILIFLFIFGGMMGGFYAIWATDFFQENILNQVAKFNAKIAGFILNLFGENVKVYGDTLRSSYYAISVKKGCDGIEPIMLFITAVVAFPINFKFKFRGLFLGIVFLLIMNLVRIVSLYLTGVYFPNLFDMMHIEVWQALFLILAIASWLFWINSALKKEAKLNNK